MPAFVSVQDFGSPAQYDSLCIVIAGLGIQRARVTDEGVLVIECSVIHLGEIFAKLADNPATDWIEYTVQFG